MTEAENRRVGTPDVPLVASSRIDEITDRLVTAIAIGEYLPDCRQREPLLSLLKWGG